MGKTGPRHLCKMNIHQMPARQASQIFWRIRQTLSHPHKTNTFLENAHDEHKITQIVMNCVELKVRICREVSSK